MLKMNWGVKITLLYSGFVALIVFMVVLSMKQKVDLVSKDYYEQELQFQKKIDLKAHTNGLTEQLSWRVESNKMSMQFPQQLRGKSLSGEILFFCPSDAKMDQKMMIQPDTATSRVIDISALKGALYKVQVTWKADSEQFYNEGVIQVH
jgi:hypothetical protein